MEPIVIIEKLANATESFKDQFRRSFLLLSLFDDFEHCNAIFIKPNLTYPIYKKGVTTRKDFVEDLVACLREINTRTKIYIGEGEGGYNSFSMSEAMRTMGFFEIAESFPNVDIVNLSNVETIEVTIEANAKPYLVSLPKLFFTEIDFSITCPVPKVHCMTRVSLSFKNQWGCLPDTMRLKHHYIFNEIIGQICKKLKFRYAFLDGRFGLNENGPMIGDPIEVNWFAASNSLGAFDMIVSEMMGFDWQQIRHLRIAQKYGLMPKRDDIEVIGDMESLKRTFVLKREFWNYPALAAFHSEKLTRLFYFSILSKLLHDIMYIFRKRPI